MAATPARKPARTIVAEPKTGIRSFANGLRSAAASHAAPGVNVIHAIRATPQATPTRAWILR